MSLFDKRKKSLRDKHIAQEAKAKAEVKIEKKVEKVKRTKK